MRGETNFRLWGALVVNAGKRGHIKITMVGFLEQMIALISACIKQVRFSPPNSYCAFFNTRSYPVMKDIS